MGKLLLKIAIGIGLLACIAFGLIVWNINPIIKKLRPQIVQAISNAVQHPVAVGEIEASVFPSTAIKIADVGLADPSGKMLPDASVKSLQLRTGLGGLLKGSINVSELQLEGARITVTRAADGTLSIGGLQLGPKLAAKQTSTSQTNVIPVAASNAQTGSETSSPPQQASEGKAADSGNAVNFAIESVELQDVQLSVIDQTVQPQQQVTIDDLSATAENIGLTREGSFSLTASVLGTSEKNFSLNGTYRPGSGPGGMPGGDVTLALKQLDLPRLKQLAEAYGVPLEPLGLSQTASLDASLSVTSKGIHGEINDLDATKALISYGSLFEKKSGLPATLRVSAFPTLSRSVEADIVDITLGKLQLSAPFTIAPDKSISAKISSPGVPLAELEAFLLPVRGMALQGTVEPNITVAVSPETASQPVVGGTVALKNISADLPLKEKGKTVPIRNTSGLIRLEKQTVEVKPLQVEVAGQLFEATSTIQSLKTPRVQWTLSSNQVDVEKLAAAAGVQVQALQAAQLNSLQANGTFQSSSKSGTAKLQVASGTLAGAALQDLALDTAFTLDKENQPLTAKLNPSSFGAFGGKISAAGDLRDQHFVSTAIRASGLDLASVSALAMADSAFSLVGTMERLLANLRFDKRNLTGSLSGTSDAEVSKGSIQGFNLLRETLGRIDSIPGVQQSLTSYIPEKYQGVLQSEGTEFESLSYSSQIDNGIVRLQNAELIHPLYVVAGSGIIELSGKLNIKAQLKLTPLLAEEMILKQPKLQLIVDKEGNIVIPVVIKKEKRVLVLPDVSQLVKRAAGNTAKEAVKRELDKVTPGLGQALDKLFK